MPPRRRQRRPRFRRCARRCARADDRGPASCRSDSAPAWRCRAAIRRGAIVEWARCSGIPMRRFQPLEDRADGQRADVTDSAMTTPVGRKAVLLPTASAYRADRHRCADTGPATRAPGSIESWPPNCSNRSRMPRMPCEDGCCSRSGATPVPLSSTRSAHLVTRDTQRHSHP